MDEQRAYTVRRFAANDEIDWAELPKAEIGCYKWTDGEKPEAWAQLAYMEGYGFVCRMSCRQSEPVVSYYDNGESVYEDDAMEFFVSFGEEGYLNLEANSVGAHLNGFGACRADRRSIFDTLPDGFLTVPMPIDGGWSVSFYLPLPELQLFFPSLTEDVLAPGFEFYGNFYKICESPSEGLPHFGMWSEVGTDHPDFHRPEYFGKIVMG